MREGGGKGRGRGERDLNVIFLKEVIEFLRRVRVSFTLDRFVEVDLRGVLFLLDEFFHKVFEEVVGAVGNACLQVLHHQVRELLQVTRVLEYHTGGNTRGVYLQHVLFQDKVLSPNRKDVGFDCTTWWPIVI